MKIIKLLIIEDHALTRIGLKTAFEEQACFEIAAEAETGEDGVELAILHKPDVIIVDLGLPGIDGIEVIKRLKSKLESKIIVLTSHDSEPEVIQAITSGANAYCMKDINPQRLASVVKEVFQGGCWLENNILSIIKNKLSIQEQLLRSKPKIEPPLTAREIQVLQLIANFQSNTNIAKELSVSQHTVKSHISNILHKLSVDDRTQAVVIALRNDWIE